MMEWIVTSSVLILVVLVLRALLRGKISFGCSIPCGWWGSPAAGAHSPVEGPSACDGGKSGP